MTDITFEQTLATPKRIPSRLPMIRKLGYGAGCITFSLPHQLLGSIFLLYSTVILGLPPLWAGMLIAISTFWDAVSDPLMGHISDRTNNRRFGRRHGYMLVGAALTLVSTWMLWSISAEFSQGLKIVLVLLFLLMAKTAQTVFYIPYSALGSELAQGYDERTSVQSWRGSFYIIGMLIALVGANMFFFRSTDAFPQGQFNPAAYPVMGMSFAIFAAAMALISYFSTQDYIPALQSARSRSDSANPSSGLLSSMRLCLQNRNFVAIAIMIFLIEVSFQISIAVGFHVNSFTFGLDGPQIALLGLALLGASVISQPYWIWLSRKTDKKPALFLGMVLGLVGFVGLPWTHIWWDLFPMEGPSLIYTMIMFNIIAGVGNGAFMTLPFSMVADTVAETARKTGESLDGVYFGFYNFAYKSGVGISLVLSGILLSVIGIGVSMEGLDIAALERLAMAPSWLLIAFAPFIVASLAFYNIKRDTARHTSH